MQKYTFKDQPVKLGKMSYLNALIVLFKYGFDGIFSEDNSYEGKQAATSV